MFNLSQAANGREAVYAYLDEASEPMPKTRVALSLSAGLSEMLGVTQLRLKGLAVNESLCCRTLGDGRPCESEGDVKLCRISRRVCAQVSICRLASTESEEGERCRPVLWLPVELQTPRLGGEFGVITPHISHPFAAWDSQDPSGALKTW